MTWSTVLARVGVAVLAALNLWWGAWAEFAPRHFFDTFPGFGHGWTAGYPPYNEHLVTDLGSTFLTLAFLLGVGAVTRQVRLRRLALAATLLFNVAHLGFHTGHRGTLDPFDFAASVASLVVGVIGPAALLLLEAIRPAARPPASTG